MIPGRAVGALALERLALGFLHMADPAKQPAVGGRQLGAVLALCGASRPFGDDVINLALIAGNWGLARLTMAQAFAGRAGEDFCFDCWGKLNARGAQSPSTRGDGANDHGHLRNRKLSKFGCYRNFSEPVNLF